MSSEQKSSAADHEPARGISVFTIATILVLAALEAFLLLAGQTAA